MRRPRSVILLSIICFSFGATQALGALGGWERWDFLRQLSLNVPLAYLVGRNVFWAGGFILLALGLWLLKPWARVGVLAAMPLYFALGWAERWFFRVSDFARVPILWAMALSLLWIALTWAILWRPSVRRVFTR